MVRNKKVVGGEQKLKSHWVRCGSSGEAQWSNHFPPQRFGAADFQVDRSARSHFGKNLYTDPKRTSLLPEEMFLWNSKNNPKQKSTPPTNACPIIKYRKKSLSLQNRDCYSIPAWVGVRGWGDVGYTADFYLDTLISSLLRDKRCLRYC